MVGDIAVLMDQHVGVGDDCTSYVLSPGDSGLVISIENETVSLLIAGHIVYVMRESVESLGE